MDGGRWRLFGGESSAGRSAAPSAPTSSATHWSWPSNAVDPTDASFIALTGAASAYTSLAFSKRIAELELDQSFSAVGSRYDNAVVESFFATLKCELAYIHHRTTWPARTTLRSALFHYIDAFYNTQRIQRAPRPSKPVDFENHAAT